MNLAITVTLRRNAVVVAANGEIDLQNSAEWRRQLLASFDQHKDVVVDLAEVGYIDSSGVAGLIEAYQLARRLNLRLSLATVSPAVMRVLKLARLDEVFVITGRVDPIEQD